MFRACIKFRETLAQLLLLAHHQLYSFGVKLKARIVFFLAWFHTNSNTIVFKHDCTGIKDVFIEICIVHFKLWNNQDVVICWADLMPTVRPEAWHAKHMVPISRKDYFTLLFSKFENTSVMCWGQHMDHTHFCCI